MRMRALLHALCIVALGTTAGCGAPLSASVNVQDGQLVEVGAQSAGWGGSIDCTKGHICVRVPALTAPICLPLAGKLCERLQ